MTDSNRLDPVEFTKTSCIDIDLVFKGDDGSVDDITDDTFTLGETKPASVFSAAGATLTKTDPLNGTVRLHVPERTPETLGMGNLNWVRVIRTFLDGCIDTTEQIWIKIT